MVFCFVPSYKRRHTKTNLQDISNAKDNQDVLGLSKVLRMGEGRAVKRLGKIADQVIGLEAVSYTHLTLPTM